MRQHRRHLGSKFSEGARLIWLRIDERGWTLERLGRMAGWPKGRALRYAYGDRLPERTAAVAIKRLLDIEPERFDEAPRAPFLPPAARVPDAPASGPTLSPDRPSVPPTGTHD